MLIKKPDDLRASEITPENLYYDRREFLRAAGLLGIAAATLGRVEPANAATQDGQQLKDELTPYEDVTTYNNFYEFGTDKSDPAENAKGFKTKPWTVAV